MFLQKFVQVLRGKARRRGGDSVDPVLRTPRPCFIDHLTYIHLWEIKAFFISTFCIKYVSCLPASSFPLEQGKEVENILFRILRIVTIS